MLFHVVVTDAIRQWTFTWGRLRCDYFTNQFFLDFSIHGLLSSDIWTALRVEIIVLTNIDGLILSLDVWNSLAAIVWLIVTSIDTQHGRNFVSFELLERRVLTQTVSLLRSLSRNFTSVCFGRFLSVFRFCKVCEDWWLFSLHIWVVMTDNCWLFVLVDCIFFLLDRKLVNLW